MLSLPVDHSVHTIKSILFFFFTFSNIPSPPPRPGARDISTPPYTTTRSHRASPPLVSESQSHNSRPTSQDRPSLPRILVRVVIPATALPPRPTVDPRLRNSHPPRFLCKAAPTNKPTGCPRTLVSQQPHEPPKTQPTPPTTTRQHPGATNTNQRALFHLAQALHPPAHPLVVLQQRAAHNAASLLPLPPFDPDPLQ